ncbi:Gfo/Idh/MocA family protein [Prevotella sp.]|uniref:Gfo/Idh/MocA family protein n=1 Tax=Prevotella sp. TaxID=59823 RepID=UPI0027E3081A|nr:Gfo/Idh/MocA family oxidoreductase [Prevotella sp.]
MEHVKIAFIGFGYRGKQLFKLMSGIDFYNIVAIADKCATQYPHNVAFYQGSDAYVRMLDEHRPDLVVVTSPWHLHVEQSMACVERGCDVALEIKGGLAMGEYDPLIRLAHQKGRKVYPMENTLFMREILAVKRMADEGVLGDIIYMRGGYRHDLRNIMLDDHGNLGGRIGTESVWRSRFYTSRNGDLYPTHGLAPLCLILGVGKRDRLVALTSFATKAVGMRQRMIELGNGDSPDAANICLGDVVSTQIETQCGSLISLTHDTSLPRPRSLDFEVQGTRGVWDGVNRRIYIEGLSKHETWEDDAPYIARYESAYWQRWGTEAIVQDCHHKGMDYVMLRAIEDDMLGNSIFPASIDDLALWTSISVLSEQSIKEQRRIEMK